MPISAHKSAHKLAHGCPWVPISQPVRRRGSTSTAVAMGGLLLIDSHRPVHDAVPGAATCLKGTEGVPRKGGLNIDRHEGVEM